MTKQIFENTSQYKLFQREYEIIEKSYLEKPDPDIEKWVFEYLSDGGLSTLFILRYMVINGLLDHIQNLEKRLSDATESLGKKNPRKASLIKFCEATESLGKRSGCPV